MLMQMMNVDQKPLEIEFLIANYPLLATTCNQNAASNFFDLCLLIVEAFFTSALRQPCTCLRQQISWFHTAASRCYEQHRKTAVRKTRSQGCHNKFFRHVLFLCDLFAFSERRTTAARHTRLSQDCCKTRKVFVRLT